MQQCAAAAAAAASSTAPAVAAASSSPSNSTWLSSELASLLGSSPSLAPMSAGTVVFARHPTDSQGALARAVVAGHQFIHGLDGATSDAASAFSSAAVAASSAHAAAASSSSSRSVLRLMYSVQYDAAPHSALPTLLSDTDVFLDPSSGSAKNSIHAGTVDDMDDERLVGELRQLVERKQLLLEQLALMKAAYIRSNPNVMAALVSNTAFALSAAFAQTSTVLSTAQMQEAAAMQIDDSADLPSLDSAPAVSSASSLL